jgi:ABC-type maltose transport system permease subunit
MSDRHHEDKKKKMSYRLARLLQRYRLIIIIVGTAVVLFPIGYYVFEAVKQAANDAAARQNVTLNEKWDEYQSQQDKAKKDALEKELMTVIEQSAAAYPDKYAGIQALFMRADINTEMMANADAAKKKDLYLTVVRDLMRVADAAEGNILAPQALMRAASDIQNEERLLSADALAGLDEIIALVPGKVMGAEKPATIRDLSLVIYRYTVNRYPNSLYVPEALINTGFILEAQSKLKEAGEVYSRLESDFASSNWTKIAVNRKIELENKGALGN